MKDFKNDKYNNDGKGIEPLRTSRGANDREPAVLAILRALMPRRPLEDQGEAERIAELQANRLLELAEISDPPVPGELITELPRIRVQRDVDLPASGSASWQNGRWLLTINGSEPWTRQRFSLCHEFKHVIDHPHLGVYQAAEIDPEKVADYFAACLLMPKRAVKRLWFGGVQQLSALCEAFEVSPPAMARRLQFLGLREPATRQGRKPWPDAGRPGPRRTYYRTGSPLSQLLLGGTS